MVLIRSLAYRYHLLGISLLHCILNHIPLVGVEQEFSADCVLYLCSLLLPAGLPLKQQVLVIFQTISALLLLGVKLHVVHPK